jgi:multidrug efflux pump subunit AcrA (membrane-fusion protein)
LTVILLLMLAYLAVSVQRPGGTATETTALAVQPSPVRYVARGQIRPVAQARVGTVSGGVIQELRVEVGTPVSEQQQLARIVSNGSTEVVTAPFAGTVTSALVRRGDTVLPGTTLLTVGDVSRLQVETTDLDEFLIAQVYRGQRVSVLVEALDREVAGHVRTASLDVVRSTEGDDHYPVTIDLVELPPELRPGMSVRIRFEEELP